MVHALLLLTLAGGLPSLWDCVQDCVQSALSRTRVLEEELTNQLDNVREDTKQAITIATSRLQVDYQRDAAARFQDVQQQLEQQLECEFQGGIKSPCSAHYCS